MQKALKGADYTMDGRELANLAEATGAAEGLVDALRRIGKVGGPSGVMKALKGQLTGSVGDE